MTITTTTTSGSTSGIAATNNGSGAISITSSGTVTGASLRGISASNFGTDVTINAANVNAFNTGIYVFNNGSGATSVTSTGSVVSSNYAGIDILHYATDLTINTVNVSGAAGIYAENNGTGAFSLTSSGNVTGSSFRGIKAINNGSNMSVSTANVTGSTVGIEARNYGTGSLNITVSGSVTGTTADGIYSLNSTGGNLASVVITSSGSVSGGTRAINLQTSGTSPSLIDNAGTINGDVLFDDGDDTFIHRKTTSLAASQIVNGSIDFGLGNDTFRNATVIEGFGGSVLPTMTGLETFANAGELRLTNGATGDVFAIPHNFTAEAGSRLSVDVDMPNGTADELQIIGTVTGTTEVSINPLQADVDTSITVRVVEVVGTPGAAAPTAFVLAADSQQIGLFQYELTNNDTATGDDFILARSFAPLQSPASTPVPVLSNKANELPMAGSAMGALFQRAIPRYQERQAGRQLVDAGTSDTQVWISGLADFIDVEGNRGGIDINARGLLFGIEHAFGSITFGGYLGTHDMDAKFAANSNADVDGVIEADGVTAGLYSNIIGADWYADLAVEWQRSDFDYDGGSIVGRDESDASFYGFALEGGKSLASIGSGELSAMGRYVYGTSNIDDLTLTGNRVEFDAGRSNSLEAGLRWETTSVLSSGKKLTWSVEGSAVREFAGKYEVRVAGGTATSNSDGTWGRFGLSAAMEVSKNSALHVSGRELLGDREGGGVFVGYRLAF